MNKNSFVLAIAIALNGGALLGTTSQANAGDLVAMNMAPGKSAYPSKPDKITSRGITGDELLARGMARLKSAKNPQDFQAAYGFFQIAANMGNAEAQFQLGIMQLDNDQVSGTEETAIRWLEAASSQGHKQAAIALSYVINDGSIIGC